MFGASASLHYDRTRGVEVWQSSVSGSPASSGGGQCVLLRSATALDVDFPVKVMVFGG